MPATLLAEDLQGSLALRQGTGDVRRDDVVVGLRVSRSDRAAATDPWVDDNAVYRTERVGETVDGRPPNSMSDNELRAAFDKRCVTPLPWNRRRLVRPRLADPIRCR